MPFDISIDNERGLVNVVLTGPVGVEEFLAGFQRMLGLPDFRPGQKILVDMRAHVHQADGTDIRRIADAFIDAGEAIGRAEVAVVVGPPVSYGLMRMLQAFIEAAPFRFSVFYSLDEAESSLGLARP